MVAAIAAANAGRVVLVAKLAVGQAPWRSAEPKPPRSWTAAVRDALSFDGMPAATLNYLDAVTSGVDAPRPASMPAGLPRRTLAESREPFGPVPPFRGCDIPSWNHDCLNSRYWSIYTRATVPGTRELILPTGRRIEVGMIGGQPDDWSATTPSAWLGIRARTCGVMTMYADYLHHLVFDDDGQVIGAAFGNHTVRVHDGVAFASTPQASDDSVLGEAWRWPDAQLGLTSAVASRFGRLELVTSGETKPVSSARMAVSEAVARSSGLGRATRRHRSSR
ncbi:hypothetical protein H7K45_09795 [Mycobacterium yunnanensis]|uniref:Uncharacterized protein n=1 Tax=Mycobacterium yunnanensis TaxID=368477 RepID=A0A9X3BSP9_9MYCO|nr:hypothetical protein [Mycobacterium yunnanensis]MCV7420829.1 hypothetical protein [Mycobacterium yunnanensis]